MSVSVDSDWDVWFDAPAVSTDFMQDRKQLGQDMRGAAPELSIARITDPPIGQ